MKTAHIHSLNTSPGGVPKLPIFEGEVGPLGLTGDKQQDNRFHGGPDRALCLYSLEQIEMLRAEGHPIAPGTAGENVTLAGLDWDRVTPGARLRLGDEVEIQITSYTTPCPKIRASFLHDEFTLINQDAHPGHSRVYARVLAADASGPATRWLCRRTAPRLVAGRRCHLKTKHVFKSNSGTTRPESWAPAKGNTVELMDGGLA